MTKTTIVLLGALLAATAAHAEERKPLPVPSRGSVCPSGYSNSPTSGFCAPNPNTRSQAIPKQGYQACPPGWHESMASFCVK